MFNLPLRAEPLFPRYPGTVGYRAFGDPKGVTSWRLIPFYGTPLGEGLIAGIMMVFKVYALAVMVYAAFEPPPGHTAEETVLSVLVVAALTYWPIKWTLRILFTSATIIELTPRDVRVLGLFGWRRYARHVPLRFELEQHRSLRRSMALQKKPRRHLRESYHVVLRYAQQAIIIANVHGEVRARALLDRLNGCFMVTAPGAESAAIGNPHQQYADRPADDEI
ncbi:hypothetical protein [Rhodospira trueperi]|uniref:Uncharacterized protein n=1 Tax=Rhodospira trueperi TaxID=69960 RepID=A0A1G7HIK5_9PROT|nr:hypothetical protein [Rhodospira trueperi]SDE99839.1 hypothetical protein SAMN05421720_12116 [Rhodospira trueperi]